MLCRGCVVWGLCCVGFVLCGVCIVWGCVIWELCLGGCVVWGFYCVGIVLCGGCVVFLLQPSLKYLIKVKIEFKIQ